jgi:HEAT repeat protein
MTTRILGALLILAGAVRLGTVSAGEPLAAATAGVDDLLGGVDYVPEKPVLDDALGDPPEDALIDIALSTDADPGMRIRAFRALAHYPGDPIRLVLINAIGSFSAATAGVEVLYLRAALHSLAAVAGENAVDAIAALLDSDSQDVRADAALALGETGSAAAETPLRDRRDIESVDQVKWAIDEALATLAGN